MESIPPSSYQRLSRALAIITSWCEDDRVSCTHDDRLNASDITLDGPLVCFSAKDILELSRMGHSIGVELTNNGWQASFDVFQGCIAELECDPLDELDLDAASRRTGDEAIAAEDLQSLTSVLPSQVAATLHVTLVNKPAASGHHWVRTTAAVAKLLGSGRWLSFAFSLFHEPGPQRLVVADAAQATLHAEGVVVHGPSSWPPLPAVTQFASVATGYRATWLCEDRKGIPPPSAFLRAEGQPAPAGLPGLEEHLRAVAHGLAWVWLASAATIGNSSVELLFEGARTVEVDLTQPPDARAADQAVELWRWAVTTADTLRREAVQRSVSLAVRDRQDLDTAARPILKTSSYLYDLAQKGEIAEALATRRSARESAFAAARQGADAARTAAQSTVNRILAQIIGLFGILVASRGEVIDPLVAVYLSIAVTVVLLATAASAYFFELPCADRSLAAFCTDLDEYRDTLPADEIGDIKNLASIGAARQQLRHAKGLILSLLVLSLLVLAFVLCSVSGWLVLE